MARRAVRVADLFQRDRFAAKLGEVLDFHNFVLQHYYRLPPLDFQKTLDEQLDLGEKIEPLVTDVTRALHELRGSGRERAVRRRAGRDAGCRSGHLPVRDLFQHHGGFAGTGTGFGPRAFDDVLGIVKAYTTRVGAGPFPTELFDDYGEHLSRVGHEFGSVTGRRRRCGWFDSVALRRAIVNSSVSGLCITKLDVLDGLDTIRICVGYRIDGDGHARAADERRRLRRHRAGVRGAARLARVHRGRDALRGAAGQCARLPRAPAGARRRADRPDFNGPRPRADHRAAAPVRSADLDAPRWRSAPHRRCGWRWRCIIARRLPARRRQLARVFQHLG